MFPVQKRNQHYSTHQSTVQVKDHRRDGGREDTAVISEVPGTPPSGNASRGTTAKQLTPLQSNPSCSVLSASSEQWEPWNPRNESLSNLRSIFSRAMGRAAELPTTSIPAVPNGSEAPLGSRLRQYQNFERTNEMETLVVEEEKKEESSSASTSLSHHPAPKTTDPPAAGPGPLEPLNTRRSSDWISPLRTELLRAADALQSSGEPWVHEEDGFYVEDGTTFDDLDAQRFRAWFREHYCIKRMLEEVSEEEKEEEVKEEEQEEEQTKEEQKVEEQKVEEQKEEDICRICHDTDNSTTDPLVSPCLCRGSLRFMHIGCLKIWTKVRIERGLSLTSIKCCELCRGFMSLDATTLNIGQFYLVTRAQIIANLIARYRPPRPSRFRRFVLRVIGWLTFRRSS
ncbi:uncharacterized protein [Clinocottus analis]|uniref:uncharacterized protein isoform X2 n=1 Tax=Clinocottus analis TaxID=304258 RepID=UPI0035BFAC8F